MIRYLSTLAIAIAAALLTPHVKAETVLVYREGQLVNPQDVAAVLGKTRGIRLLDDPPAAPSKSTPVAAVSLAKPAPVAAVSPAKLIPVVAVSPAKTSASSSASARTAPDDSKADVAALSLPVRFAFDSAEILPAARAQLDAVAEGIKLLAPESIVTIEGHTDAVGSDAYNLELSRLRAHAVRDYLVQRHGIDAARLKTVGYGKGRPIEGSDPNAALNRRVQFRGS